MQLPKVEILTIGDEILYGQIQDTNATWLSSKLSGAGFRVVRRSTVGDRRADILEAFKLAEERADIILITGGLGPTADDLTKPLLTEYFGTTLVRNQAVLKHLEELFAGRNRTLSELNKQQADVPKAGEVLHNAKGTAPGMWLARRGKVFVSMPGVPHEMKPMVEHGVLPKLKKLYNPRVIYHRKILTAGIPESVLSEKIKDWEHALPESISLAYLPHLGLVDLRLTAVGSTLEELQQQVKHEEEKLLPQIKKYVYGYDAQTLAEVVGKKLLKKDYTIGTAESCTSGYLASMLTSQPGSSAYYQGSIVAYHNSLKEKLLNVKAQTLESRGAVSEDTVIQMAEGIKEMVNATVGIATSGIAGPTGGTAEKPVGTVWIGISTPEKTFAKKYNFTKDRDLNIKLTATVALTLLWQTLTEND